MKVLSEDESYSAGYNHLSIYEKVALVCRDGKLIFVRSVPEYKIAIYCLYDFYVVIVLDTKERRVKSINGESAEKNWSTYTEEIIYGLENLNAKV